MQIAEIELLRYRIPFRTAFSHAAATRSAGDAIVVRMKSADGVYGYGEIQARPYVTGESNDEIWNLHAPALAAKLAGASISSIDTIADRLEEASSYDTAPALCGGFDMALHDALDVAGTVDWCAAFGPVRHRPTTRCLTIGENYEGAALKKQAMVARLSGCGVVKLKVKSPRDAERVQQLRDHLGPSVAIRLDANGCLQPRDAEELLRRVAHSNVESIEEPVTADASALRAILSALHNATGIPLVADESVCTPGDVMRLAGAGGYQVVNVRVGKCGGVTGTRRVISACREKGAGMVSGTMVGETAVLLAMSKRLLAHCNELDYVEGIDQAGKLLEAQPVTWDGSRHDRHFVHDTALEERYLVDRKSVA